MTSLKNKKQFESLFETMNQKLQHREINSAIQTFEVIVDKYQQLSEEERVELAEYYISTIDSIKKNSVKQSNYMSQLMDHVLSKL